MGVVDERMKSWKRVPTDEEWNAIWKDWRPEEKREPSDEAPEGAQDRR